MAASFVGQIVQNDLRVPLKDRQLDSLYRAVPKRLAVLILGPASDFIGVDRAAGETGLQLCQLRDRGLGIPRADVLADVAAEDPVADFRLKRRIDPAAVLDR